MGEYQPQRSRTCILKRCYRDFSPCDGHSHGLDAVHVPNFATVAPLLASSDLLTTLPTVVMTDAMDTFGLVAARVPIPIEPMPHVLAWSARLTRDPASVWVRARLRDVIDDLMRAASRLG
ncbi:MAG TPA: hypothetical protein VFK10_05195 [Burkholderiaceae bacterium]|nr:hypothetical protein [Burkholderiaceae bacterium]